MGGNQPGGPAVPESLKPLISELEELAKQKKPPKMMPVVMFSTDFGRLYKIEGGSKLTIVNLSYTPVTDEFLTKLKELPDLEYLYLMGTQITDEGLRNLGGPPALKGVCLHETQVTDQGVANFRDSHPHCKVGTIFGRDDL
jgi:Leucine-rich repeat (LRR) protein